MAQHHPSLLRRVKTLRIMAADVLLVTAGAGLASQVRRLCALAGCDCEVERESSALRALWRQAGLVLVGDDLITAVAAAGLPRRDRILVVTEERPDAACWNAALAVGARRVLTLPEDQTGLVEELRTAEVSDRPRGRLVGVMGGCGGAGASTLASGLALTASATGPTVLVDGDPLGGGLDVLLGVEDLAGLRWADLVATRGRLDPAAFADALCRVGGIALLAWGASADRATTGRVRPSPAPREALSPAVVDAVIVAAVQAFTTAIVDLPRVAGHGDNRFLDALDGTVLVVPAEVRAVAATASLIDTIGSRLTAPHLVVRESTSGLAARDVASSLGLELVAVLRHEQSVQVAGQRGDLPLRRGRGALAQVCEAVLATFDSPAMSR